MTSLAAQLAQNVSLNSALLVDRSRRKPRESYLFTGKEADNHDLDSLHALGINGLIQLSALNLSLRAFEGDLFSDQARSTDRTLLSSELNTQLNKSIAGFLSLLGPYLLESPTNKVLEWLVRRFRINEFNIEDVLALFLPYHETPHFAKMLTILHIKPNSTWSFLLPFKTAAQSVPRSPLVAEMLRNTDFTRFVASLLPSAMKMNRVHRVLLTFNAACLHDFITRSKSLNEGTVAFLLPALLEPLISSKHDLLTDSILGTYVLLAAFSQKCHITAPAMKTIVGAMARAAPHVSTRQFLTAIIAVCAPQEQQEEFSEKVGNLILRFPSINSELQNATKLVGFDKLSSPLLRGLAKRMNDGEVQSLMSSLLMHQDTPTNVLEWITELVLEHALSLDAPQTELRPILLSIHQRHPAVLRSVSEGMVKNSDSIKPSMQQLLVSLSLDAQFPTSKVDSSQKHDMVVASTSADSNVRIIAVKELLGQMSSSFASSVTESELESVQTALTSRVQDTDSQVLDVIYGQPDIMAPLLLKNPKTFIDTLSQLLCSTTLKPKRNVLKTHMTFLAKYFCNQANKEVVSEVFYKLFFPFLLFSKSRQHTAEMVWNIIEENMPDSTPGTHELLYGCSALVAEEKAKNEESIQMMSKTNLGIASKIARNALMSDEYNAHFESLTNKLNDENPHVQVLAHLIMHALINQLSGEHQIDAAYKTLEAIGHKQISNIQSLPEVTGELLQGLDSEGLARHTVVKPSSKHTLHWLQLAIVAIVPTFSAPAFTLDWMADLDITSMDMHGRRYVELMRLVYHIANTSSSPVISTSLLHVLFVNLKDEALGFLAGIWSGADNYARDDEYLRVVALQHASAFLQAHIDENDGVDFQTIMPMLLIALSSPSVSVRQAALKCMAQLQALTERKLVTVYKFDAIYGTNGKLQYLDQNDFKKYLAGLNEESDHLIHDSSFVRLFHERHLKRIKSDKRKESEYKRRVLCYLLSHVQALSLPTAQVALLRTIENISDKAKAQILSPVIKVLISTERSSQGSIQDDLTCLCISSFNSSVAGELNEADGTLWSVYISMIRHVFTSEASPQFRAILSTCLEKGLFAGLDQERKITLCELMLEIGVQDHEMYGQCKKLLTNLLTEIPLILHLLNLLQPASVDPGLRASKRPKTVDDADGVLRLTLLIEILGSKPLPGSLDLVTRLLDMSSRVMQSVSPAQADISYIEQLLMSAIDNAADGLTQLPNVTSNAIRLDILVELIRVSDNPQTFYQALLLISKLSRLAPESALHNVMPVFTFMGSNVFQRDDTYSFKVVQQTIESIVPVMVSSLKQTHADKLDLFIASKDFLRVFTDASNHIPRHRRNNFFSHLVDVLGPSDFLAPICMLIVGKLANRVVRQTPEETQTTLALPISIHQHCRPSVQINSLTEILYESQRLTNLIASPSVAQPTVMDDLIDDESSKTMILKRRAKALISFVGVAITSTSSSFTRVPSDKISLFISTLISLASLRNGANADGNVDDIRQAAYSTIGSALTVMPAASFVASVLTMVEIQDGNVQTGALDLLGERLPLVADSIRQEVTSAVKKIVHCIRVFVASPHDNRVVQSAFRALRAIALSLQSGEESVVTDIIPFVLSSIKQQTAATSVALASLAPISTKLGPRFIPYMRDTVAICVDIISTGPSEDAHAILHGLLKSIPTFWGAKELTQVISTYTKHWTAATHGPSQAMSSLIKAVAKRAPPKVLLSSMIEAWPTYKISPEKREIGAYFDVMTRTLRGTERSLILELLRQLAKVFLESFDAVATESNPVIEENVISAFKQLVIKLNDTAFKPIYRRLYDWAYASDIDVRKKVTFQHIYASLLDYFKALMTPYMSFLLQPMIQDLQTFSKTKLQYKEYWIASLDVLTKSLNYDDGAYWRDDKLRQLSKPLIAQVVVCADTNYSDQRQLLQDALNVLVDTVTDDSLLKSINLDLLMHTRSEDVRLRVYALSCSEMLWRNHGGKLLGLVAETATFIAECNEDENDTVVKESLRLKNAVEGVAGSIKDL